MADTATLPPIPAHLDADEIAWLVHEAAEHPELTLGSALAAIGQVHPLHMAGGCS